MKILKPETRIQANLKYWRDCPDRVPTESTIKNMFYKSDGGISDDYTFVDMNNACITEHHGHQTYQLIVDKLTEKTDKKFIFIVQSINPFIDTLNFYGNVVFSPHASTNNGYISIPHYTVNTYQPTTDKKQLFSFMGAPTHQVRIDICNKLDNCELTSGWFDSNKLQKYQSTLSESVFGLCPRGTGLGTIRMWETLSMGTIPVIISNGYKKPLENHINWDEFSITIPEQNVSDIPNILSNINTDKISDMVEVGGRYYNEYFSNVNLNKTIIKELT